MSQIILKIWYSCNHRCDFCHAEFNKTIKEKETLKTIKKIFYIKKHTRDIDTILLSWWEPTIQDNFFRLLSVASGLGFKTWVVTNGSMLYREDFLQKCLEYNFCRVYLSIHWGSEVTQTKMTWSPQSFSQICTLLKLLQKHSLSPNVNCVVTKNNIDELEEVVHFLKQYWVQKVKFSLLEPKWLWYTDIENLFVRPDTVAQKILSLIDTFPDIGIYWDGLPLCLVQWYENKMSNLQTEGIQYMSEIYEDEIFQTDYGVREYSEKCFQCRKKDICYGNFQIYNELYGNDYLL